MAIIPVYLPIWEQYILECFKFIWQGNGSRLSRAPYASRCAVEHCMHHGLIEGALVPAT